MEIIETIQSNKWIFRAWCIFASMPTAIIATVFFLVMFIWPDHVMKNAPEDTPDYFYEILRFGAICAVGGFMLAVLLI